MVILLNGCASAFAEVRIISPRCAWKSYDASVAELLGNGDKASERSTHGVIYYEFHHDKTN